MAGQVDNRRLSFRDRGQGSTITRRRPVMQQVMTLSDSKKEQRLAPVQFRSSPHKMEVNMCKSKEVEVQQTIELTNH